MEFWIAKQIVYEPSNQTSIGKWGLLKNVIGEEFDIPYRSKLTQIFQSKYVFALSLAIHQQVHC